MEPIFTLLVTFLVLVILLYNTQPDPPSSVIELSSGGLDDIQNGVACEIKNLAQLQRSAIVYTWVNGTENCYNKRREQAGLTPGGSSRDKEMGELKYSIRSLLKYVPWLQGPIYIVTPGQIPDWLDLSNPRIKVIDQDDLLPKDKMGLPNFNTHVIEQYLYKIPDLTDIFIHMNDDYVFIKPITPHRFFTCDGGIQFLTEINHIRHVQGQKNNAWLASVRNTIALTDTTYGGQHVYNFLKHAPFIYSRKAFEQLHVRFEKELDGMLGHQVRHYEDLNIPLLHHIYMNEEGSKLLNIPIAWNPLHECDDWLLVRIVDDRLTELTTIFQNAIDQKGSQVLLALNDEYSEPATAELMKKFYTTLLPDREFYELPDGQFLNITSAYHGPECLYDRKILPLPSRSYSNLRQRMQNHIPHSQQVSPFEMYFKKSNPSFISFLASMMGFLLVLLLSFYFFRLTNQDIVHPTRYTSKWR